MVEESEAAAVVVKRGSGGDNGGDRNGNGSGSGRVFSYPDPTRGARPVAQTAPFRVPGFFPGPRPTPAGPHGPRLEIGPNSWPNQKKKKSRFFFSYVQAQIFFCHSSLHIPNKKIKPKFIFTYIQACIFKFKPR